MQPGPFATLPLPSPVMRPARQRDRPKSVKISRKTVGKRPKIYQNSMQNQVFVYKIAPKSWLRLSSKLSSCISFSVLTTVSRKQSLKKSRKSRNLIIMAESASQTDPWKLRCAVTLHNVNPQPGELSHKPFFFKGRVFVFLLKNLHFYANE